MDDEARGLDDEARGVRKKPSTKSTKYTGVDGGPGTTTSSPEGRIST